MSNKQVDINYTNYKGETFWRRIEPVIAGGLEFSMNRYHPEPQWLLMALDISGDGLLKSFSMKDIHQWKPASGPVPRRPSPNESARTPTPKSSTPPR